MHNTSLMSMLQDVHLLFEVTMALRTVVWLPSKWLFATTIQTAEQGRKALWTIQSKYSTKMILLLVKQYCLNVWNWLWLFRELKAGGPSWDVSRQTGGSMFARYNNNNYNNTAAIIHNCYIIYTNRNYTAMGILIHEMNSIGIHLIIIRPVLLYTCMGMVI